MANAFDMFKRMQKLIVPDYSDYIELTQGQQFTCPSDGFLFASVHTTNQNVRTMNISINGVSNITLEANDYSYSEALFPVSSGDKIIYTLNASKINPTYIRFFAVREN